MSGKDSNDPSCLPLPPLSYVPPTLGTNDVTAGQGLLKGVTVGVPKVRLFISKEKNGNKVKGMC